MTGLGLWRSLRQNASTVRFNRTEASGAVGDLGTLLPLLLGMAGRCGFPLAHALLFAGVAGVISGLTFGIPIPIQPMKAIAIVAITEGMSVPEILAAGLLTGAVMLLLAVTGLIDRVNRAVPRVLVRAIQLALGLKLLFTGFGMSVGSRPWMGSDSIALTAISFALVLWLGSSRQVPAALAVLALGFVPLLISQPHLFALLHLGLDPPSLHSISKSDWIAGLWRGAVPQIPLTVLNSVLAVSLLSADLFGPRSAAPRKIAFSLGLLNLLLCPFGAMPMCHGAGGLAAHYRHGGRTGGCVILLGLVTIALALLFGSSLMPLLNYYPRSVLGVLLAFAGVELVTVCRDQKAPRDILVMLLSATACVATNFAIGFLLGCVVVVLIRTRERILAARPTSA